MPASKKLKTKKNTNNKQPLSIDEQLNQQWQRINRLKAQNERFGTELNEFANEAMAAVGDSETLFVNAIEQKLFQLIPFLSRKTLADWKRSQLLDFFELDFKFLEDSPFYEHKRLIKLYEALNAVLEQVTGLPINADAETSTIEENIGPKAAPETHTETDIRPDTPKMDMFDELFNDFKIEDEFTTDGPIPPEEEVLFEDYDEWYQSNSETFGHLDENQDQPALEQLFSARFLKTVFRKLSRILHPDREQNEQKKALRHQQMAALIKARDEHDVFTLLDLYKQHTGESALTQVDIDKNKLLRSLKAYAQMVREQKEWQLQEQAPHVVRYYTLLHSEKPAERKRNYAAYNRDLREDTQEVLHIAASVTSIPKLTAYLENMSHGLIELEMELEMEFEHPFSGFER